MSASFPFSQAELQERFGAALIPESFVVHGPAALFPGNRPGQLGETTDGGATWNPV